MAAYSTPEQISGFLRRLGASPLLVLDMDGNVMRGLSLGAGHTLPLGPGDDPTKQAIPYGTTSAELDDMVNKGILVEGIFAEKPMDARLPGELVRLINDLAERDQPRSIAILTSRGSTDARKLLEESGVEDLSKIILVAESGATLFLGGERIAVRALNTEEQSFLYGLDGISGAIQMDVKNTVEELGFDPAGCPMLLVEHKGTATNLHFREVLKQYGQADNSPLDKALSALIKEKMDSYISASGMGKTFKTLDAPASVEVKTSDVNKGHGLRSIISHVLQAGDSITSVVFAGDDVSKGNGHPGTDWYAMVEAQKLEQEFGVPVFNIHTHHPVGNDLSNPTPDPDKAADTLSEAFNKPRIDVTVNSPRALVELIVSKFRERDARGGEAGFKPPSLHA